MYNVYVHTCTCNCIHLNMYIYINACGDARSSPTFILQPSLNAGLDLKNAVALPEDEKMNDWIAVHGKITTDHVTIV